MILSRRRVMAALPASLLATTLDMPASIVSAWAAPALNTAPLAFSVWRKGSRLGTHTVAFRQLGDTLSVRSAADFAVGLGPIDFYKYRYRVTETWRDGVLQAITARTDDNGKPGSVEARRIGAQLVVNGSKSGQYTAPAGSIAGTHWNKAELGAPIINCENGELMHFTVVPKGSDTPPGGAPAATHYALSGFATLDLWFGAADAWVGLRAVAKDGSIVEYHAA